MSCRLSGIRSSTAVDFCSPKKSARSRSKTPRILNRLSRETRYSPFSIRDRSLCWMPIWRASSACVSPRSLRRRRRRPPMAATSFDPICVFWVTSLAFLPLCSTIPLRREGTLRHTPIILCCRSKSVKDGIPTITGPRSASHNDNERSG